MLSLQYHMMLIGQVLWAVKELFLRSKEFTTCTFLPNEHRNGRRKLRWYLPRAWSDDGAGVTHGNGDGVGVLSYPLPIKIEMSANAYHSVKVCNPSKKTHRQFFSSFLAILCHVCIRIQYECSTQLRLEMILCENSSRSKLK